MFGNNHRGGGSLALHPALYCYDRRGKFVGKSFIGAIEFVRSLSEQDKFFPFTEHRGSFEDFLIAHPFLMNQIGESQGSGGRRGVSAVVALYTAIFKGFASGADEAGVITSIKENKDLSFLDWQIPMEADGGRRFTAAASAEAVINLALEKDICPQCGGRFYIKDRSHDHKVRLADGGKSVISNLELMHPYCNTGYKEKRAHAERTTGI